MAELTKIFARHEGVLKAAGWWWPDNDVRLAAAPVESTRLDFSSAVLELWLAQNPAGFTATVAAIFGNRRRHAVNLLIDILSLKHDLLLTGIADPTLGPVPKVAASLKPLVGADPLIAVRIMRLLLNGIPEAALTFPEPMVERGMDLMEATDCLDRVPVYLVQLLRHQERRIRSKAALLVAKTNQNVRFVYERYAREADARVRANLIEGLWEVDSPDVAEVFWKATRDLNHRVVANALVGLCGRGDEQAMAKLKEMAAHPNAAMRAAGAWAMGRTANPQFCEVLTRLFRQDQGGPKRNALQALVRIRQAVQESGAGAADVPAT